MSYFRPEIQRMAGYVPGEQPQGGKFIKLNTNENPYPPSPQVITAIEAVLQDGLARYPDPLATSFRLRAADVLGIDPDWILCGNGSDDILTITTRALVGPGDVLRFPYPSYILYATLAEIQGALIEQVPFAPDWTLPKEFGLSHNRLKLVVVPNPNSPTGTMVPKQQLRELAEQLPCPLLVDEAYVDFADWNCLDLVSQNERIMVSRSLSKSYALAGLRFGFLVAQPHLISQFRKVKDSYNCDALSVAGAAAAIGDQRWLKETRSRIIATRARLTSALRQLGFDVIESQANFVWAQHKVKPARQLYEQLKAQRVLVRYMEYPGWADGLRITVGTDEQIDVLIALVREMV